MNDGLDRLGLRLRGVHRWLSRSRKPLQLVMIILVLVLPMRSALTIALVTKLEQVEEMRSLIVASWAQSSVRIIDLDYAKRQAGVAEALSRRSRGSWWECRRVQSRGVVRIVHSRRISTGLIAVE